MRPHRVPLPELEAAELTPATLRTGLRRQGCVLVRGLITPDRADALAGGIDRALDAFDAAVAGASEDETQPWYVPFAPKPGQYRVGDAGTGSGQVGASGPRTRRGCCSNCST